MKQRAALYVRVSTTEQSSDAQVAELKEYARRRGWQVSKIYRDEGISGAQRQRPGLDDLFTDARRRRFDIVLVHRFDRFARSLHQLITALVEFRQLGVNFASATEAIDTSLPHGELVFNILGALAQWERALISDRVRVGLNHARRRGKRLGRPPVGHLTEEELSQIRAERQRETTPYRELAKKYGISVFTAHTVCQGIRKHQVSNGGKHA